jgi:hypothetical protein
MNTPFYQQQPLQRLSEIHRKTADSVKRRIYFFMLIGFHDMNND